MPLSLMDCLARLMRRVMVASGTRNARATSAVVRPPRARNVSAICDAGESDGWQHMNSKMSVSSDSRAGVSAGGADRCSGRIHWDAVSSRRWRACSRRRRSVSLREATVISQARGLSGIPPSAIAARPRSGPPGPHPRPYRNGRNAGPTRQWPAAPNGATGPGSRRQARPGSDLQFGARFSDRPDFGDASGPHQAQGMPRAGPRSRSLDRSCHTPLPSSRRGPRRFRRTARL